MHQHTDDLGAIAQRWFEVMRDCGDDVRELAETHANIYRVELATGRRDLWKTLTPADPTGFEEIYAVHIADDEQSYYYTISRVLSDLYLVRGLR